MWPLSFSTILSVCSLCGFNTESHKYSANAPYHHLSVSVAGMCRGLPSFGKGLN